MALYPIHQTYGQLNGSVFYATDQTKLYRNIGIGIKVFGLLLTFYLIGPRSYGGLALGANGIALSMIIVQFIGVNIQLLFNTKYLNLSFSNLFFHQCLVIGGFGILAYGSNLVLGYFVQENLFNLFYSALIYFTLVSVLVYMFPMIISLTRSELINQIKNMINIIKNNQ